MVVDLAAEGDLPPQCRTDLFGCGIPVVDAQGTVDTAARAARIVLARAAGWVRVAHGVELTLHHRQATARADSEGD